MAKNTLHFVCRQCGGVQSKWVGKCPDCGQWDTLEEFRAPAAGADQDRPRPASLSPAHEAPQAMPIGQVEEVELTRWPTGISELDRVLGGSEQTSLGIVPGSVVMLGGDPGIGKSTLLLQAADRLANGGQKVLYVSSEESARQTRMRAQRLGAASNHLFVLADTNLARIIQQIEKVGPSVVVIDSIQMIYKGDLPAAPGSVTQLRTCCQELVYLAKASGIAVFLVGHVTKEGQLAGPRLLEHMVDTVLYFEGDRYHHHRIVRAIKNRFGTTLEVGLFQMDESGLQPASDAAGLLAAEYRRMAGSVVCPVLQGTRCLLVEMQGLTAAGILGAAKRKVSGLDANRLAMLIAVLEKRGGLRLADQDVFVSSVGGMKVAEPAADLAVSLAIAGAHLNRQLPAGVCAVGEIGLGGEVRRVQGMGQRMPEAMRLGFHTIITPLHPPAPSKDGQIIEVANVGQAMEHLT